MQIEEKYRGEYLENLKTQEKMNFDELFEKLKDMFDRLGHNKLDVLFAYQLEKLLEKNRDYLCQNT